MSLHEVINEQLKRLHEFYEQSGDWTGEDYLTAIAPLHESLRLLAQGDNDGPS